VIITSPVNANICPNTGTTLSVVAQGTGLNYKWLYDKADGMGYVPVINDAVHSGADASTLTLNNVPQSFDGYLYKVEITGTCQPVVTTVPVLLEVSDIATITDHPSDSTVCEFNPASFSVAAEGAGLTYRWQVNTGSGWNNITTGGNYTGVTTNKLLIYNIPRTMNNYMFRAVVGSTCSGEINSDEAVLRVNTSPKITVPPVEAASCPGETASFSVTAEGNQLAYKWQINTGGGFADLSDTAPYSGVTTDKLTITGVTSDMNGSLFRVVVSGVCTPPATSPIALLRVSMLAQVLTEPQDGEVCDGSMASFMANILISGPETLQWQVKNSSGWSDITDNANYQGSKSLQLVIRNTPGSFNGNIYRLAVLGPCDDVYTREALLTVHMPPVPDISPLDTILLCGGTQEPLNGHPSGGSGVYAIHRWLGDIGPLSRYDVVDPIFFAGMAGNYQLFYSVTDDNGCTGRDTIVVKVEKPTAMFTLTPSSGCQPLTVNPVNNSTDYKSLVWDFGDGTASTDPNPSHTYTNTSPSLLYNDLKLVVESANGCRDSMIIGVTVYPEITSDFELSKDVICSGERVILSSLPGSFRYFWDYGDGEKGYGSNVVNHVFKNSTSSPVVYNVKLTATSYYNCTSETTLPITVYPMPEAAFTAVPVSQVWPSSTVNFTNNTNPGTWTWLWNLGDGSTSSVENPSRTYAAPGEYVVTLYVNNVQCSDSAKHSISVLPIPPVADFDSVPSGCSPLNITLNNTSLNTEMAGTTYKWDFGDGSISTAKNPTYTYFTPGIYRIELIVSGPGGTSSKSQVVSAYPSPKAYFEIAPPLVFVNDEKVRGFNLSQGAVSYVWDFGDGDTSHVKEPFHKYMEEGIYDITLWAYSDNGCSDVYVLSPGVTVEPVGDVRFATVFRPNLDGPIERSDLPTGGIEIDQFFFPPVREKVLNYKLQVFNRLGVLIFESHNINIPWNGYYKGKLCPQGVYVWYVEGKFANGKPYKKVGDITLLH
jgi:PKD repeat protein